MGTSLPPDPLLGTVLANYLRLDRRIGAGGMGAVYAARDLKLERDLAVKVLLPGISDDADALKRLEREARVTANIRHVGIPTVHDADTDEATGRFYFTQELLTGFTLAHELYSWRPPPRLAITRILGILDALGGAHERGIVHRDVKPGNVFLDCERADERVYVLDFGISKELRDVQARTKLTRGPLGTPDYFAPEVLDDASKVDVRADVWSAGIVLYEMLAWSVPWQSKSFLNRMAEIAAGKIPDVREFCPWPLPDGLLVVLRRALQVDPGMRYRNANDFARAIRALDLRGLMALTVMHRTDGIREDRWRPPAAPSDMDRAHRAVVVSGSLSMADETCMPQRIMNMIRWAIELDCEHKLQNSYHTSVEIYRFRYLPEPPLPGTFRTALDLAGFVNRGTWWTWEMPAVPWRSLRTES